MSLMENKTTPLVSVIIPNYNHARFLDERIESVLNQTFQNFEIIILDDKSSDNSVDVINKYKDNPHVSHVVINEQNSGKVFYQWHKGFELARGLLIWIAESDDKCLPTLLEELVQEFKRNKNLVLAFTRTVCFTDDGHESISYGDIKDNRTERMDGHKFISKYMAGGCYVTNASSALFRKDIALIIDNQYTTFKGAGDRLFWIEIAEKGNVAIVNKPLNYCRRHGNNVTNRNITSGLLQREDKRIMDYLSNNHLISFWKEQWCSSEYIYSYIIIRDVESESLKENLLNLWNYRGIKYIIVCYLKIRTKLSNLSH